MHLTTHASTRANFSGAWLKLTSLCALSPRHSSSRAHVMFRTLLDPPPTSPSLSTPTSSSLLFPSHWPTTSTPQTGLLFGRFAKQSPHRFEPAFRLKDRTWDCWPHLFCCRRETTANPSGIDHSNRESSEPYLLTLSFRHGETRGEMSK